MTGIPGVTLTLHPRLRALGLRPRHSTFQVGYLPHLIIAANNRITTSDTLTETPPVSVSFFYRQLSTPPSHREADNHPLNRSTT